MADVTDKEMTEGMEEASPAPKRFSMLKVGLPVLLAQIIVAYFLASYVIVPMFFDSAEATQKKKSPASEKAREERSGKDDDGKKYGVIHQLEDIIVNPAESQGSQFLLINLALEVKSKDDVEILKKREVIVRDILIRLLSGKTVEELDGPDDKERLREEIKKEVSKVLPEGHLYNVYFSNYIIQ